MVAAAEPTKAKGGAAAEEDVTYDIITPAQVRRVLMRLLQEQAGGRGLDPAAAA